MSVSGWVAPLSFSHGSQHLDVVVECFVTCAAFIKEGVEVLPEVLPVSAHVLIL